jgi:cytochrome c
MRLMLLLLIAAPGPAVAADPVHGRDAFQACAACHSDAAAAIAPSLNGIIGRPAGTLPIFRYSGPLKRSGVVWTAETLRSFIAAPQTVIPGNRMPFSGASPQEAADIVAYLETLAASEAGRPR